MSIQTRKPAPGDIVAVISTSMGDIEVLLFPDAAPKAVDNFISLANRGYYDGVIFHRVIPDFMIQGGDPTGTGSGGESIWGMPFEDEFDKDYHNICGALSMANAGRNTNGSQFFIVQVHSVSGELLSQMKEMPDYFPAETVEDYENLGGTPWLDFKHTVFGQVYSGMDVVDSIAAVERNYNDKPLTDVVINNILINTVE